MDKLKCLAIAGLGFPDRVESQMSVPVLSFDQVIDRLISAKLPHFSEYLAMYSSWYGGITTDQPLMMIPMDDHMVHRGDGIFEAFKCTDWKIYALHLHLDRLKRSMATSSLQIPVEHQRLMEIIFGTIRAGGRGTCLIRLFISRGPGSFGVSPYESIGAQVYVVVTTLHHPEPEKYETGVNLMTSSVPVKSDYFATAKHCNYLPNALMKKEATDAGAYFPVSLDEKGFLAESATENIGIITKRGEFIVPRFLRTLRGITISRVLELAGNLVGNELTAVFEADITPEQAYDAAEILAFGTTFDILPVVEYDGKKIGDGRPGPLFRTLLKLIVEDQLQNPEMITLVKP